MSAEQKILSHINHSIRTPLNTIIGFSELLQHLDLDKQKRDYVNAILWAGQDLLSSMDEVFGSHYTHTPEAGIQHVPFKITGLIFDLIDRLQKELNSQEITIDAVINIANESLFIDERGLKKTLCFIMDSAVRRCQKKEITFQVDGTPGPEPNTMNLEIAIKESGLGLSPEEVERIFSRNRAKQKKISTAHEDSLGITELAKANRLICAMGGRLFVHSNKNKTTTVTVTFDKVAISASEVHFQGQAERKNVLVKDTSVLILDPLSFSSHLLEELLKSIGARTALVKNAHDAVKELASLKPALVIMDLNPPVEDALAMVKKMRESVNPAEIPIIALTTITSPQKRDAIRHAFDGILIKPITRMEFFKELNKHLELVVIDKKQPLPRDTSYENIKNTLPDSAVTDWESLQKRYWICRELPVLQEITAFGSDLANFSRTHDLEELLKCTNKLSTACQHYDFQGVEKNLQEIEPYLNRRTRT